MDEKAKVELRKQHGALAEFTVKGVYLAFRKAGREDWDNHQKKIRSDKHTASAAFRELCQKCLVTSIEDFLATVKVKPAFPAVAVNQIAQITGRAIEAFDNGDDTATLSLADGRTWDFTSPSFESWEDCQEQLAKGRQQRETIFRELAARCVVKRDGLDAFFEEYPAGHENLASVLTALAGGDIEGEVKKG